MDVVRLGLPYTTTWMPDKLIEGYSSMIWTERFWSVGDFQLKTTKIDAMKAALPIDCLISHTDTGIVMMVEDHNVAVNEEGEEELTVTGRSLDFFPEHRWVEGLYKKKRLMPKSKSVTGAAIVLLYNSFDNGSGIDVTVEEYIGFGEVGSNQPPDPVPSIVWNLTDKITNICITDSVSDDGSNRNWWLTEGSLAPQLNAILARGKLSLRVIRPIAGTNGQVCTVAHSPSSARGDITRTFTENITALRFDLYKGVDRTGQVSFSYLHGDFSGAQYLQSSRIAKTAVEVMSSIAITDTYRPGESGFTGLRRRVTALDVGEPDIPDAPEKPDDLGKNPTQNQQDTYDDDIAKWKVRRANWRNRRDNILTKFRDSAKDDALTELDKTKRVSVFTGDISPLAPYVYQKDYNLGDRVTLYGDYGMVETMIVSEHIRTEDAEGDHSFPGLTLA